MFYLRARQDNPSIFSGFLKAGSCHDPPQLPGTLVEPDWSGTCIDPLPLPSKCQNYGNVILKVKKRRTKMLNSALPTLVFVFCFCLLNVVLLLLYTWYVLWAHTVWLLCGAQRTALWSWFLQVCMVSGCQTQTVRPAQQVLGLLNHLACPHTMLSKLKKFMIM